jgi:hypothetical protein
LKGLLLRLNVEYRDFHRLVEEQFLRLQPSDRGNSWRQEVEEQGVVVGELDGWIDAVRDGLESWKVGKGFRCSVL